MEVFFFVESVLLSQFVFIYIWIEISILFVPALVDDRFLRATMIATKASNTFVCKFDDTIFKSYVAHRADINALSAFDTIFVY